MAEQNPIRYQDLITPDDSIEKLIGQLEELQKVYTGMVNEVKQQAETLASSLTKVSGANEKGRKSISQANEDAKRLEKAYKQLDAALSQNAKEIARLNVVRREANNYNKQMVLRGKEEIQTRQQIKEASYQQLSAQYSLNKAYINSLSLADRQLKKNKELIKSTKEIYEQMKKLQADTGKNQLNVGNYPMLGGLVGGLGGKALGLGGAAAAGMALAGVVKDNISLARDYEKTLSVLAAILNTTKDGVRDLSEQAQQLGATTVFTAKEVAELQIELAKLGYTTEQIQNMTPAVLNFAQATGSSLADAASLAGAALRMFEKDTTHTTEFVDKMSAATTKSALNFSYLQNAMSTIAPVANAFGFQLEDVLALLGQLANAGFDASSAATAARNIILNLADANGKLAQALGEPVTDLDGLIAGLNKLNEEGIDLGESLELTDKRSVAAFNTFLSGANDVKKLRDELANADGWAQQMADTMTDNLEGSVKGLESAWQGLNLTLNQSNGLFRDMVDLLTKVVRKLESAAKKIDSWWRKYKFIFTGSKEDFQESFAEQFANQYGNTEGGTSGNGSTTQNKAPQGGNKPKGNKPQGKTPKGGSTKNNALREQEQAEKESLALQRAYEDAMLELIEDADNKEYAALSYKYERQIQDLQIALDKKKAAHKLSADDEALYNKQIETQTEVRTKKLNELAAKQNQKIQDDAAKKKQKQEQELQQSIRERERAIEIQYQTDMEEIEQIETSEKEKTRMRLEAEKERLKKLLALYQQDGKKLGAEEIKLIQSQINGINQELEKNQKKDRDIYDVFGFKLSDEKKEAIDEALSYSMDALGEWVNGLTAAADKERELADAQVDRAQSVLEKELEARANGYANDVETARKELELAKKNQAKAIEQQKRAQKIQIALDTASQAANLITASSLIWKQLGFPWAIPALAVMWGSFAAAKIKAVQAVGAGDEKYAEGTVELLEGGSHQSGNDIDLGRKPNGTRRRAEGGEFFAVINKRNSRKYRGIIPDVINSLNQGTFAEKYLNAYDGANININANQQSTDLTRLSDDVQAIREQGEKTTYYDGKGNQVVIYKNLKRVVKN